MIATNPKYFFRLATVIAVAALGASGCVSDTAFVPTSVSNSQSNPNPTPTPPGGGGNPTPTPVSNPQAGQDIFSPPAIANNTKIDLVFIVDNSGSMADNQTKLIASLNDFITQFVLRGADWRISLLSTDVTNGFGGSCYSSYAAPKASGNWLSKYAGLPWLGCDASGMCNDADVVGKFKANVALGTCGSGDERGIDSLMLATDAAHLAASNAGFFRADSYKAIIVISDENQGTLDGANAASAALISDAVNRMKSLGSGGYGFYFVNDLKAVPADNTDGDGINQYPAFYRAMANTTGSLMLDISDANWGADLVKVGDDIITTAQKEFKLSHAPIAGSIHVYIDVADAAHEVAQNAVNGWQYNAAPKNSIELYGTAKTNAAGHQLIVKYMY